MFVETYERHSHKDSVTLDTSLNFNYVREMKLSSKFNLGDLTFINVQLIMDDHSDKWVTITEDSYNKLLPCKLW